jgi:N-formylglutamate amidohydrolase
MVAIAAEPGSLVITRVGSLPILLTAPHGGLQHVPDVPPRSRGTTTTDGYTIELTETLAKHLAHRLGGAPYIVAARFSRKYIDANRAEADAFDSPRAKPVYEAYHAEIRRFVADIKVRFPRGGLLLDIHGQSGDPGVVHRGTRDGATVASLIRTHGPAALEGPNSILGTVQAKGYTVFPPASPNGKRSEDRRYFGGYTVYTYGNRSRAGLDAVQLEVGRDLRRGPAFIASLGEGVVVF